MHQSNQTHDLQIRVFISSTFRDMQEERNYLVKFIFPRLRRLCESRGATWGEVDLRWGGAKGQAEKDQALDVCLRQTGKCRTFFIGLSLQHNAERLSWFMKADVFISYSRHDLAAAECAILRG